MGEICCVCGKVAGIAGFSEVPYGALIDGKDYCVFCYIELSVKEQKAKEKLTKKK